MRRTDIDRVLTVADSLPPAFLLKSPPEPDRGAPSGVVRDEFVFSPK
jgi:hypothetical protein